MPYQFIRSHPSFKNGIAKMFMSYAVSHIMLIPDNLQKTCETGIKADYKIVFRTSKGRFFSKYVSKQLLKHQWDSLFEKGLCETVETVDVIDLPTQI